MAIKKINSKLKFLYRTGAYLNCKVKKLLVSALIQSHFDYGCNFWFRSLNMGISKKLQTAQNKTIRYVLNLNPRTHLSFSHFSKLKWLNVKYRVDYLSLTHMYKCYYDLAPSYMCVFQKTMSSRAHNTRHSQNSVNIPIVGTHGQKSFVYNGSKLWNSLPNELKLCASIEKFKYQCKSYLMSKMRENEVSEFVFY